MTRREVLGFVVAPLPFVGPLILLCLVLLLEMPPDSAAIAAFMIEIVAWGYAAAIGLGLPIHLILKHRGRHDLRSYILATVGAAFIVCAGIALAELIFPHRPQDNPFGFSMWSRFGITSTVGFAICASYSAFLFWKIAVKTVSKK